jgi:hypothetical protein
MMPGSLAKETSMELTDELIAASAGLDDLELLETALDGRGEWDVWRQRTGRWVIQLSALPTKPTFASHSLFDAMRQAIDYKPLPICPRRPSVLTCAEPVKRWGKWIVWDHYHFNTKRQATEFRDTQIARRQSDIDRWVLEVLPLTEGRQEGVDFLWDSAP